MVAMGRPLLWVGERGPELPIGSPGCPTPSGDRFGGKGRNTGKILAARSLGREKLG